MKNHANIFLFVLAAFLLFASFALAQDVAPVADAVPRDIAAAGKSLQPEHKSAAIIKLHGEVNDMMLKSLHRRVDIARKQGCTILVYELDTYGGLLTSALEMSKFTKRLPDASQGSFATVAWDNDKAYSAGAIVAVSCQQIVMVNGATMGDAAPIAVSGDSMIPLGAAERAKIESPLLQDLEDSADRNHYNRTVLWAMIQPSIEIHEMKNKDDGSVKFVDTVEREKLLGVQTPLPGGGVSRPWVFVNTVDSAGQLLTVAPERAIAMGLAKARIDNEAQLRAALNITGDVLVLDFNWAELATMWLTQWWVRGILFFVMAVLVYIEFSHPGISIAGIGALICLVLLIGAPFLTGLAQTWQIAIILLGVVLIISDFFIFGGTGFIAIPGILLMIVGIVASFVPAEPGGGFLPTNRASWNALTRGMSVIATASVLSIFLFYFLSRYLYITPGFRRLQLPPTGVTTPIEQSLRDSADRPTTDAVFVGALGIASSELRPAGKARFGQHLVDVVTNGQFVSHGSEIEVLEIFGNRVVVKPRPATPSSTPSTGDSA